MNRAVTRRLEVLETPLQRAYRLARRGVSPEHWPDAELEAYCAAECADLKHLSDEELAG
jgi:hypothetical protein